MKVLFFRFLVQSLPLCSEREVTMKRYQISPSNVFVAIMRVNKEVIWAQWNKCPCFDLSNSGWKWMICSTILNVRLLSFKGDILKQDGISVKHSTTERNVNFEKFSSILFVTLLLILPVFFFLKNNNSVLSFILFTNRGKQIRVTFHQFKWFLF